MTKLTATFLSLCTVCISSLAQANSPAVFQGKVSGATGFLARAGYTDCQVKVSSQSQDAMLIDFTLLNSATGTQMELPNLTLTKDGREGILEKMMYDFGVRTAPQAIDDSSIIPQATLQYNNLVKIQANGSVIEYHFQDLRTNREFYKATSDLVCRASLIN